MIDLQPWRANIGHFHLTNLARYLCSCVNGEHKFSANANGTVSVGDVCLTWICALLLVVLIKNCKQVVISAFDSPFILSSFNDPITSGVPSSINVTSAVYSDSLMLPDMSMADDTLTIEQCSPVLCSALFVLALRRLRLSNDVEENPGPLDNDRDIVNSAEPTQTCDSEPVTTSIKNLELMLQCKLDCILSSIQTQAQALQRQEDLLRHFNEEQEEVKKSVEFLCNEVSALKSGLRENEKVTKELYRKQNDISDTVSNLELEIDRLEAYSRRNNIKLLGIPEDAEESGDCTETICRVLQSYIPETDWEPHIIERAHRIGRPNHHNPTPRPVIARFHRWGDAMSLMKNRQAKTSMAHDGIRATQDLTKRQSQRLRQLREEGKTGFYVNGRLRIRDNAEQPRLQNDHGFARNHGEGAAVSRNNNIGQLSQNQLRQPTSASDTQADVTAARDCDGAARPVLTNSVNAPRTRAATRQQRIDQMTATGAGSDRGAATVCSPSTGQSALGKK